MLLLLFLIYDFHTNNIIGTHKNYVDNVLH